MIKKALVCGAGGFIGGHLVKFLKEKGYWVRGVDLKYNQFHAVHEMTDHFVVGDLRDPAVVAAVIDSDMDEIRNPKFTQEYYNHLKELYQKVESGSFETSDIPLSFKKEMFKVLYNKPPKIR